MDPYEETAASCSARVCCLALASEVTVGQGLPRLFLRQCSVVTSKSCGWIKSSQVLHYVSELDQAAQGRSQGVQRREPCLAERQESDRRQVLSSL